MILLPASGAAVLVVAGCATTDEGPYPRSDGWRQARVERVVQGAEVKNPRFWKCTRRMSPEETSKRVYALVSYRDMHHKRRRMAPLPKGVTVRAGDDVYANISRCSDSLVPASNTDG